jgi:metal-dependent amidase/aminoacylase/carboxypeptidase family protein
MNIHDAMQAAVRELVLNNHIKHRLISCYLKHLQHINEAELPTALRAELARIRLVLVAAEPLPGETNVQATVRKMSIDDAERLATDVVTLASDIAKGSSQQLSWSDDSQALVTRTEPRARRLAGRKVTPMFALQEG